MSLFVLFFVFRFVFLPKLTFFFFLNELLASHWVEFIKEFVLPQKGGQLCDCVEPFPEVPACPSVKSLSLEATHQGVSLKSGPVEGNLHCSLFIVSQVLPRMPDHI